MDYSLLDAIGPESFDTIELRGNVGRFLGRSSAGSR